MQKKLSTNLQYFQKITVDSTLNIWSNVQPTFTLPKPTSLMNISTYMFLWIMAGPDGFTLY